MENKVLIFVGLIFAITFRGFASSDVQQGRFDANGVRSQSSSASADETLEKQYKDMQQQCADFISKKSREFLKEVEENSIDASAVDTLKELCEEESVSHELKRELLAESMLYFNDISRKYGTGEPFLAENYRKAEEYVGLALLAQRRQASQLRTYIINKLLKQRHLIPYILSDFSIFSKLMSACGLLLITDTLKNEFCKKGVSWSLWPANEEGKFKAIVAHYTAGIHLTETMKTFLQRGVSSQVVITPTGEVFFPIPFMTAKGFHAGPSFLISLKP